MLTRSCRVPSLCPTRDICYIPHHSVLVSYYVSTNISAQKEGNSSSGCLLECQVLHVGGGVVEIVSF